tara:strand:+ start:200 stop:1996 length:1797 start_codon:yes stop_codon:yes gene_type:complete
MKSSNKKGIIWFYRNYYLHTGNKINLVLFISLISVLLGGLGITFVIPLLSQVQGSNSNQHDSKIQFLDKLFSYFNIDSVIEASVFISILFIIKGFFKFLEGLVKASLEANLLRDLKNKMFSGFMLFDYNYYASKNTGHFINLMNEQISLYTSSFGTYIKLITNMITGFVYISFALFVSWKTLFVASIIGAAMLLFFQTFNKYIKLYSRLYTSELTSYNKSAIQSLHGFKYIVATNQYPNIKGAINKSITNLSFYFKKSRIISYFIESVREPILMIIVLSLVSFQSIYFGSGIEEIAVVMLLLFRSMTYLSDSQAQWQKVIGKIGSIETVNSELDNLVLFKEKDGEKYLSKLKNKICFQNLSFSYEENKMILNNLNFEIVANTSVGVVGPSGSGKSTFLDIISMILKPSKGKYIIDGTNSEEALLSSWRDQIGYVCQESVMFDDTIANNIGMWKDDFNSSDSFKDKIINASKLANVDGFVKDFKDGYNTMIGDRGVKLSGGQKQRIFVARELMKNPTILLLDEATSALDTESEIMIKKSIDNLKGKLTVVIVAHRISTVKNCDKIIVMKNGSIIEIGDFKSLESSNLHFKNMIDAQSLK